MRARFSAQGSLNQAAPIERVQIFVIISAAHPAQRPEDPIQQWHRPPSSEFPRNAGDRRITYPCSCLYRSSPPYPSRAPPAILFAAVFCRRSSSNLPEIALNALRRLLCSAPAAFSLVSAAGRGRRKFIVVSSTTSTEQPGLFKHLLPAFEQKAGVKVRVVVWGLARPRIRPAAATPTWFSSTTRRLRKIRRRGLQGVERASHVRTISC